MTVKMFTLESATKDELLARMHELLDEKERAWETYAASKLHDDYARWSELDDQMAAARAELESRP